MEISPELYIIYKYNMDCKSSTNGDAPPSGSESPFTMALIVGNPTFGVVSFKFHDHSWSQKPSGSQTWQWKTNEHPLQCEAPKIAI